MSPVTKLREHWDETNSKVLQRKAQLDAMLGDSQRYEAKRQEVDAWLTRMETRLERMGTVGHTADVLEAQLREQKVNLIIIININFPKRNGRGNFFVNDNNNNMVVIENAREKNFVFLF